MRSLVPILCVAGVLAASSGAARAEGAQTNQELKALEQTIQEQSKRLDALTLQITKLTQLLETKNGAPSAAAPSATAEEPPKPAAAEAPAEGPKVDLNKPEAGAPKAEAVNKHTVAKGETLTSIAKHYNIALAELQKANKIENDRKLQIGQVLTIPTPKTPEPTTEKKENP